ncbi:unnamed protein product, partial [Amoebophrya sp. A25]|eukprot:GSA25T00027497001.1
MGSPILKAAGKKWPQVASCFLTVMDVQSVPDAVEKQAEIMKLLAHHGGVGIGLSSLGGEGVTFRKSLKALNEIKQFTTVPGKRSSALCGSVMDFDANVIELLESRDAAPGPLRVYGVENQVCVHDLCMKRAQEGKSWTLFDTTCPRVRGLARLHGEQFVKKYEQLEQDATRGLLAARRFEMPAVELLKLLGRKAIENGSTSVIFIDQANRMSNQKHRGTIQTSNLCAEILQYSDGQEVATCMLGIVNVSKFATNKWTTEKGFKWEEFGSAARLLLGALDNIIDQGWFPVQGAEDSCKNHRAVGIGLTGFQELLHLQRVPYECGRVLHECLYAHLYATTVDESATLAEQKGPYRSFQGSPTSRGIFHSDHYPSARDPFQVAGLPDARQRARKAMRNSLVTAQMPTHTQSILLGVADMCEPTPGAIFKKKTAAGEAVLFSHVVKELEKRGEWTWEIRRELTRAGGSVQSLKLLTNYEKQCYRTVYEIGVGELLKFAADRAPYLDQSQSINFHLA